MRLRVLLCLVLVVLVGCSSSSGGGDSITASDVSATLDDFGFALAFSSNGQDIDKPVLFIGGLTNDDVVATQLGAELDCRQPSFDAVFRLSPRRNSDNLESPEVLIEKTRSALRALAVLGIQDVAVFGHGTGGLVARAAVASEDVGALPLNIELITLFTPFAGLDSGSQRPGYPQDFSSGNSFIESPAALPANVQHRKIKIDVARPSLILTGAEQDAVFPGSQDLGKVDSDPRLTSTSTVRIPDWPFGFDVGLRSAFDSIGLPPNTCPGYFDGVNASEFPENARVDVSSSSTSPRATARAGDTAFDKTDFASSGLQAPLLPGNSIDPAKSVLVLVSGVNARAASFDKLELLESTKYNVFRFVYDPDANSLGAEFAGITQAFSDDTNDLEVIADRFVASVAKLRDQFGLTRLTIVAHGTGGNIARRALILNRTQTLANSGMEITFVSVGTPYAGFDLTNFNPVFWLSSTFDQAGLWYSRLSSASDFVNAPGALGTNVHFGKVELVETGSSNIDEPSDSVLNLRDQANSTVDNDPQLLTGGDAGSGILRFRAGQVGVLTSDAGLSLLGPAIDAFEARLTELLNAASGVSPAN